MKKYLTRQNLGWVMSIAICGWLLLSVFGKFSKHHEVVDSFTANNIGEWITIIGIGELVCLILFLIPRTMKLGLVLLAAYFGGAIMFHMSHPLAEQQGFTGAVVFLVLFVVTAWVRGNELVDFSPKSDA